MSNIWPYLILLLALPYLVVPILIRRNHFFTLKPRLRSVLHGFLPAQVESFFDATTIAIAKLGFEPRIDAVSLDFGPDLKVFMRLFVSHKKAFVAICSSLIPEGKTEPIRNFIEFGSRYKDGHELSTHNSDLIGAPIEHPLKTTTVLPRIDDVNVLFAVHEQTAKKLGFDSKPMIMPDEGVELDYLIQSFHADLSHQAKLGCLELDEMANGYRPTWAGAFLLGWYSMWPISPAIRFWQRCKAKFKIRALLRVSRLST